jgi:zeaxanthin glucosyltransferase
VHFGIISPPVYGHLHPFCALARELIARGHRATCLQLLDLESKLASEEVEFYAIGQTAFPRESLATWLRRLPELSGVAALRFTVSAVARTSRVVCEEAPAAIRKLGIDALLVDQMEPAGGAVAEHLGLPFITVCNALPVNRDPVAPPPFAPWAYTTAPWARLRNGIGYLLSDLATRPITKVVASYRKRWGLPALARPDDSFSPLAQICQMPQSLDFPRVKLPSQFHYVGPLRRPTGNPTPFPWERLDGRPIIYVSLGTLQNGRFDLFQSITAACVGLPAQVVISHGGGLAAAEVAALGTGPVVVNYAPQLELMSRATLTITHAGLNTVLDSLSHGVPVLMIPITYEQPAIARRVEQAGAGLSVTLSKARPERLRRKVLQTLHHSSFRKSATRIRDHIQISGGVSRAADVIETSLSA